MRCEGVGCVLVGDGGEGLGEDRVLGVVQGVIMWGVCVCVCVGRLGEFGNGGWGRGEVWDRTTVMRG